MKRMNRKLMHVFLLFFFSSELQGKDLVGNCDLWKFFITNKQ